MEGLDWPKAIKELGVIQEHFAGSSKSVSVAGFCMGGALSLAALASHKGWKAGGVFYGVPDLNVFRLDKITAKVMAHFGSQDVLKGFSDKETAERLYKDCKKHDYPIDVRIYQGCNHAFCNQDSRYFNETCRDNAFKMTRQLIEK